MPKIGPFWRVFDKPEACGQTVLPDRSVLIDQKLVENAKIQMRHLGWFFKHCDMVGWFWKKNKKTINKSVDCYYWIQSYFCDAGFWWIGKLSEPFTTTKFVFPDSKDSNQFLHWKCTLKKWFTLKKNASEELYTKSIKILNLNFCAKIYLPKNNSKYRVSKQVLDRNLAKNH